MPSHPIDDERKKNAERFANITEQDISEPKARRVLRGGEIEGRPLTEKKKKFFGFIAGGGTPTEV